MMCSILSLRASLWGKVVPLMCKEDVDESLPTKSYVFQITTIPREDVSYIWCPEVRQYVAGLSTLLVLFQDVRGLLDPIIVYSVLPATT